MMPPIEMRPLNPVSGAEARIRPSSQQTGTAAPAQSAAPMVSASDALDPGAPPIGAERVSEIRRAVESGAYPVLPTRIADAMIAAGFLLRTGE